MKLAIIKKWNTSYGDYDIENNYSNHLDKIKCRNYFQKKNFVIYSLNETIDNDENLLDFLEIYDKLKYENSLISRVPVRSNRTINSNYKLKFVRDYYFKERSFCNVNYHFEYFIKKCKKYYSKKLKYYEEMKSPKKLLHRQIHGKSKFYFNNA